MREAGAVPSVSEVRTRMHRGAAVFTLVTALAVAVAALMYASWSPLVFRPAPSRNTTPSTPAPTSAPTAPPASALASAWVRQSASPGIVVGGTATISFTFRNAGSATWKRGTPSEARLGVIDDPIFDPSMAVAWPYPERPAIQAEEVVAPGQLATFTFKVKGSRAGIFRLRVRPVVDGVAWLNDQGVYIDIEVR